MKGGGEGRNGETAYLLGKPREKKHSTAVWFPDRAMLQFMLVLSSSCILPCWDRLPKSHLRETKGRYNDGSDVSINNLGKLEVLHKHNYGYLAEANAEPCRIRLVV